MPTSSSFRRALALIPFGYLAVTRLGRGRDWAYLVASGWVPAAWIAQRWGGGAAEFVPGYLAFIAVYEIGYLVNDAYDAPRDPRGRRRIDWPLAAGWIAGFVGLRLAVWAGIGVATGWIAQPLWLGLFAALGVVFALHNLVPVGALRIATFAQLATLRFIAPIAGGLALGQVGMTLALALVTYTHFRLLAYLDGKGVLVLPARARPDFGLGQMALFLPILGLMALAGADTVPLEVGGYFLALYGAYAVWGGRRG